MKKIRIKKIKRKIRYHWLIQRLFFQRMSKFRKKVRAKSKGLCGLCGGTLVEKKHQVHHIFPKRHYPELRCKPKNGVCLCIPCHRFSDAMNLMEDIGWGLPMPLKIKCSYLLE